MERWTAESVLNLARGFMESRILLSGVELDLFNLLDPVPLSADEIAQKIQAERHGLVILLDALAAIGLLIKQNDRYQCDPQVQPLLTSEGARTVLPMVQHAANLWQRWSNLTAAVAGPHAAAGSPDGWLRSFIEAMHTIAAPQAHRLAAAAAPAGAKKLLDVGGASGTYTIAFLELCPELQATLFDRPPVIAMARKRLEEAGMLPRVTLAGGDFMHDALPGGHDLAWVSAIIHQNSLAQNAALFANVFQALTPGGRIVVRDHVLSPDRIRPKAASLFAVNMLTGNGTGNCYTFDEIREGLTQAGFISVNMLAPDVQMDGLIEAFRPQG